AGHGLASRRAGERGGRYAPSRADRGRAPPAQGHRLHHRPGPDRSGRLGDRRGARAGAGALHQPDAKSLRARQGPSHAPGRGDPHRSRHRSRAVHRASARSSRRLTVPLLILSGKEVAAKVLAEVKADVAALRQKTGVQPTLAVILVGDDPASQIYVRNKKRAADDVGINSRDYLFPQGCTQAELLETIAGINRDSSIHGVLLQLPLPKGMDEDQAVAAIATDNDADGLHPTNLGQLLAGKPGAIPCTPAGCIEILDHYGIPIEGAEAVVVGRSRLVGKPLAQLLLARHATVTMCQHRPHN